MRVLHLSAGNMYGGVERVLGTLARCRHLAPGMDPEFGLCFRGRAWDELTAAGVRVHDLGAVRASRPWTVLRARRRLSGVLAAGRFDAAVVHSCWPHAVFAPAVRRAGVRLAAWVHDEIAGRGWIERWAARTPPDVVIANSRFTAGAVAGLFPGVRAEVVYLPVELPRSDDRPGDRAAVRKELGTPPGSVVILQASRLERWKGHAVLVEAVGRLRDVPGWECWLAGGPQKADEEVYFTDLKREAVRLGVGDRVRFLGQRSDVPRLMAAADVYCQPNTRPEPFGIAFVEALAAGLPVVTAGVGGGAEVVTPACGVLTPTGDVDATAAALVGLVRDPVRRAALGAAGPARAEELCHPDRQLTRVAGVLGPVA